MAQCGLALKSDVNRLSRHCVFLISIPEAKGASLRLTLNVDVLTVGSVRDIVSVCTEISV